MSGDIRRGLELCIRAVEIAEAEFRCAASRRIGCRAPHHDQLL